MRILGLVEGERASALSGIPRYLFEALGRRFEVVGSIDYALHGFQRMAIAAASFRPSRDTWRARFHTSRLAHRALSRTLGRRASEFVPDFDLAIQVFGWASGQPRPYAIYVDQTRLMAERGWPAWMPFASRERAELLALERGMYEDAFHLFLMNESVGDSLVDDYDIDPSRLTVVGGGLNFDSLPDNGEPSRDPTILFVGRDFERKGGDVLLRAFEQVREQLPEARLDLVGVTDRFDIERVVVHGKVFDRRRLAQLYRSARVFCLPSRYEPFGLVLAEAMAHGIPCVGSEVQAIPEILDEGRAGLLVPPNDPNALADSLLELLTDYELARRIGSSGRQWVERSLTWDHVVERMAPVLERAGLPWSR